MTMPMYVSPEQLMKDRADYARKGISRGRAAVASTYADGVLLCAENPSNTLRTLGSASTASLTNCALLGCAMPT
jgi:proteasome alpha subunit